MDTNFLTAPRHGDLTENNENKENKESSLRLGDFATSADEIRRAWEYVVTSRCSVALVASI